MANAKPIRIKTISEFHQLRGFPKPEHPLISVIDYALMKALPGNYVFDFYSISIKRGVDSKLFYGQQQYDFDEGIMFFMAPNQVLRVEEVQDTSKKRSGWILQIHPDFLWNTSLAKKIKQYEYFGYSVNEALHLSEKEETIINDIVLNVQQEYCSNIDKFSKGIIISQIETLLNYAERFYQRQFITRKITNHQVLSRLEKVLGDYFNNDKLITKGLPTVEHIADALHLSQSYLSSLLKVLTGRSTQQHIHDALIEKAKEKLSITDLSASEIAYELGFEHPQSFSKLFKSKTSLTPLEYRNSYN